MKRDDTGQWIFQDLLDTSLLITSGNQDASGAIYVTGSAPAIGATAQAGGKPERAKKQRDAEEHLGTVWRVVPADQVPAGAETAPV
jgi:hypothetical protein